MTTTYGYRRMAGKPLDPDERTVLEMVSRGATTTQIGRRIALSEDGVKSLVRRILAKTEAASRPHAVRRGFELGYLDADADTEQAAS